MVAQPKSELTVVSSPFPARDEFRAHPRPFQFSVASAFLTFHIKPERARRRAMAIDSNPNAISTRRFFSRHGRPPTSGPLLKALPTIAMSRVQHGKQDAYRYLPPGRDPGRGGPWSEGRRVRLRVC